MIGTAAALLGSAIIGGIAATGAAKTAVKGQQAAVAATQQASQTAITNNNAATDQARGLITDSYNATKGNTDQAYTDTKGWRDIGMGAFATMANAYGIKLPEGVTAGAGYTMSDEYKNRLDTGTKAITTQAASRGLLDSGATGKALVKFGQSEAAAGFNDWFSHLSSIAGVGFNATQLGNQALTSGAQASANYGNTLANLTTGNANNNGLITIGQGNNAATGATNTANINSGLISNVGGIASGLLTNMAANKPSTPSVGVAPQGLLHEATHSDWRAFA